MGGNSDHKALDTLGGAEDGIMEAVVLPSTRVKSGGSMQSAVALAYAIGDAAPRVVAKGKGLLAQAIIDRAQASGVYVHSSPELVSLLMQVDLDQSIPPQLYVAVAELLAWLYRLEQEQAFSPSRAVLPSPRGDGGMKV